MDLRDIVVKVICIVAALSPLPHVLASPDGTSKNSAAVDAKIYGGDKAASSDFRYNVWIRWKKDAICGGSLIDPEWVLTAASCLVGDTRMRKYRVVIGDYNREGDSKPSYIKPTSFFIHPEFNSETLDHNIALILLTKPAKVNQPSIAVVPKLADTNVDTKIVDSSECYMTGWGTNKDGASPKRLQYLPVSMQESSQCANLQDEATEMCYSGAPGGTCSTDEGNPILCMMDGVETQVGVHARSLCSDESTVATRLSAYSSWIETTMDVPANCGRPPSLNNGKFKAQGTFVGDVASLKCAPNHRPSVPTSCDAQITCLDDGTWSSNPVFCNEVCRSEDTSFTISYLRNAFAEGNLYLYITASRHTRVAITIPFLNSVFSLRVTRFGQAKLASSLAVCSSEGTSFMIGYLRNAFAEGNLYLYITASRPTRVTITIPFLDSVFSFRVTRFGQVKLASSLAGVGDNEVSNKGVNVRSEKPVTVYMHSYRQGETGGPSGDGSLVIPEDCLSPVYSVIAHDSGPDKSFESAMMIVAAENDTSVFVISPAGPTTIVDLDRFGTYHIQEADLSGYAIYASSPVAVFSGHECGNVPNNMTEKCDHLVEQIPPEDSLDFSYIVTPFSPRPDYSVRIQALFELTDVIIRDNVGNILHSFILNTSDTSLLYNFTNGQSILIEATKYVLVAQYAHGNGSDTGQIGDPAMLVVTGLSSFLDRHLIYTPTPPDLYNNNWIAVILSACYELDGLRLNDDNITVTDYVTGPGYGTYAIFNVKLTQANNELYHVNPLATFGVVQYGFNELVQYAWMAGRMFDKPRL